MTKLFVLPDTLPDPYLTIHAGDHAALAVRIAHCRTNGNSRMAVEIWRDDMILCRLFAKSAEIADEPQAAPGA